MRSMITRCRRHPAVFAAIIVPVTVAAAGTLGTGAAAVRTGMPRDARPAVINGWLTGVAATSARNAWAAGNTSDTTLSLHWNGTAWTRVPTPNPDHSTGSNSSLAGVTATAARNAWAVGSTGSGPDENSQILLARWTGTAWRTVHVPGAPAQGGLFAVTATSARNAWAVGYSGMIGSAASTLILHWNGRIWKRVASPNRFPGGDNELTAVAATSASNAWAIGFADGPDSDVSLILHWNGTSWTRLPSPPDVGLNSITAISARDAWAAGITTPYPYQTAILHWDGTTWTRVPSPDPTPSSVNIVYGIAATSARDVWAVGDTGLKPMILHWNGTTWAQVPAPCPAVTASCSPSAPARRARPGPWARTAVSGR